MLSCRTVRYPSFFFLDDPGMFVLHSVREFLGVYLYKNFITPSVISNHSNFFFFWFFFFWPVIKSRSHSGGRGGGGKKREHQLKFCLRNKVKSGIGAGPQ